MDSRQVAIGPLALPGDLAVPPDAAALVLFAHGSGSSRLSERNRSVAAELRRHRLATLLFDLLDDAEAAQRRNVFDIDLLASRVVQALDWVAQQPLLGGMPTGLFGASTGAAAALAAAVSRVEQVGAVVSRGGRPDLAAHCLALVRAPTLLIVGGEDHDVLDLNRQALTQLACQSRLDVVSGATHLFEEPGALARVAALAAGWFEDHLVGALPPGA